MFKSLLLSFITVLMISACGGNDSQSDKTGDTSNQDINITDVVVDEDENTTEATNDQDTNTTELVVDVNTTELRDDEDTNTTIIVVNTDTNVTDVINDDNDTNITDIVVDVDINTTDLVDDKDTDTGDVTVEPNTDTTTTEDVTDVTVTPIDGTVTIESLELSAIKTEFIRRKEPAYDKYVSVYSPIKVMALYSDGHSEEVTDNVKWNRSTKSIAFGGGQLRALKGKVDVNASFQGLVSNTITINVKDIEDTHKLLDAQIRNNDQVHYPNRGAYIRLSLIKKPTKDVILTLKLKQNDGVRFATTNPKGDLEMKIIFNADEWVDKFRFKKDVWIKDYDLNNTKAFTIITEAFESEDSNYNGINPDDLLISKPESLSLEEPKVYQKRGAIRGNTIKFQVTSTELRLDYELIDPPVGMSIIGDTNFREDMENFRSGVDIEWKVPLDIEEKQYDIFVKAVGKDGRTGEISFSINVPKTTLIQTEVKNNELIVTDQNSRLFGMKMKGHNGEDISSLELRNVSYRQLWKKDVKTELGDVVEYVPFVIQNMPSKLDIKMPEKLDSFSERRNTRAQFFTYEIPYSLTTNHQYWIGGAATPYDYEGTDGITAVNSSALFLLTVAKSHKL